MVSPSKADALRDQVALALKTLSFLVGNGFMPLNQQAGNFAKPVILIAPCGKCQYLRRRYDAEIVGRGKNELGTYQQWRADVNGCLVEWMEVVA